MLAFHPWANVGGRIPAEICMRICLRFYVRVLSLLLSLLTFLVRYRDETASNEFCFLLRYPKGRSADRVVQGEAGREGGDTNICSSGFAGFEILTNPGCILSGDCRSKLFFV